MGTLTKYLSATSYLLFNINILIIVPHVGTLPSWIDEDLWNDPDTKTLRLFFDILPLEDSGTSILNATLKLHIKERTGKPYVFVVKSCQKKNRYVYSE